MLLKESYNGIEKHTMRLSLDESEKLQLEIHLNADTLYIQQSNILRLKKKNIEGGDCIRFCFNLFALTPEQQMENYPDDKTFNRSEI